MRTLLAATLLLATAVAQTRVFDFNTTYPTPSAVGLGIGQATRVGNEVASFGGYDGVSQHLYFGDGTNAGTRIVQSFPLHADDSNSPRLFAFGSRLLFTSRRFDTGRELWISDGAPAGTYMLADLMPGPDDGVPFELPFVEFLGKVWFTARDPQHGFELWSSDGTVAGTQLAADLWQGPSGSNPTAIVVAAGKLFLLAGDGAFGRELWVSDGTPAGTNLVADLSQYSDIGNLMALGNGVVFTTTEWNAGNELFFSDGTAAGTAPLRDIAPGSAGSYPRYLVRFGNEIVFQAQSAQSQYLYDLWRTDGTPAGTVPFLPQWTLVSWEFPLIPSGPWLYRWQAAANTGWELWRTDGTPAGTSLVLTTGPMGGYLNLSAVMAPGGMFLVFDDGVHGREPWWVPDGGSAALLADLRPGPASSMALATQLFALGGEVWLVADDGTHGNQLWKYWPATGVLQATADLLLPVAHGNCVPAGAIEQDLLFTGRRDAGSVGLWRTDGTLAGTTPLHLAPASAPPTYSGAVVYQDGAESWLLYDDGVHGVELWRTGGTAAATAMIADLDPGPGSLIMTAQVALDGALLFGQYFQGQSSAPRPLWCTDGTAAGTLQLHPDLGVIHGCRVGEVALFLGYGTGPGLQLWRSDGTLAGTVQLSSWFHATALVSLGDHALVFAANGLWRSDGTAAGTVQILASTPQPSSPPVRLGGVAYYPASTPANGSELWRSDGTASGTTMVVDIHPGSGDGVRYSSIPYATADRLFFVATEPATGTELWVTDGTTAGTQIVKDILPGVLSAMGNRRFARGPALSALADNRRLLFLAEDLQRGEEFWITDGTAAGTVPLAEVAPNSQSAWAQAFVRAGDRVWWQGRDDAGFELWSLPLAAVGMGASSAFGRGCHGNAPSRVRAIDVPQLGNAVFAIGLERAQPTVPALLLLAGERSDLPLGGCRLYPSPAGVLAAAATDGNGRAVVPVPVPATPALLGAEQFAQWLTIEAGGPVFGLAALSDALHLVVGG